jgi:hypothetical protein
MQSRKTLRNLQDRIKAQNRFGNYVIIHRSRVKGLDDTVFYHCNSIRSAKYQLSRRTKEFRTDPNDWSQHLDFVFVAEPVAILQQKIEEPAHIDLSTIVGKVTFSKQKVEDLYWKADYHGLDCASRSCTCKEETHKRMFKKIRNDVKTIWSLLYGLAYQTPPVYSHKKTIIWDQFSSINNMLDELFIISEEHGLTGVKPICSCLPDKHVKMKAQIEATLDAITERLK